MMFSPGDRTFLWSLRWWNVWRKVSTASCWIHKDYIIYNVLFPSLTSCPWPAFIGFETNNQYEIKNSLGQKIYKAKEKNDCCTRNCCGSLRSFDMKIKDTMDREVIRLIRPFRCVSCWCPCCLQEVCVCVCVWVLGRSKVAYLKSV